MAVVQVKLISNNKSNPIIQTSKTTPTNLSRITFRANLTFKKCWWKLKRRLNKGKRNRLIQIKSPKGLICIFQNKRK